MVNRAARAAGFDTSKGFTPDAYEAMKTAFKVNANQLTAPTSSAIALSVVIVAISFVEDVASHIFCPLSRSPYGWLHHGGSTGFHPQHCLIRDRWLWAVESCLSLWLR